MLTPPVVLTRSWWRREQALHRFTACPDRGSGRSAVRYLSFTPRRARVRARPVVEAGRFGTPECPAGPPLVARALAG